MKRKAREISGCELRVVVSIRVELAQFESIVHSLYRTEATAKYEKSTIENRELRKVVVVETSNHRELVFLFTASNARFKLSPGHGAAVHVQEPAVTGSCHLCNRNDLFAGILTNLQLQLRFNLPQSTVRMFEMKTRYDVGSSVVGESRWHSSGKEKVCCSDQMIRGFPPCRAAHCELGQDSLLQQKRVDTGDSLSLFGKSDGVSAEKKLESPLFDEERVYADKEGGEIHRSDRSKLCEMASKMIETTGCVSVDQCDFYARRSTNMQLEASRFFDSNFVNCERHSSQDLTFFAVGESSSLDREVFVERGGVDRDRWRCRCRGRKERRKRFSCSVQVERYVSLSVVYYCSCAQSSAATTERDTIVYSCGKEGQKDRNAKSYVRRATKCQGRDCEKEETKKSAHALRSADKAESEEEGSEQRCIEKCDARRFSFDKGIGGQL